LDPQPPPADRPDPLKPAASVPPGPDAPGAPTPGAPPADGAPAAADGAPAEADAPPPPLTPMAWFKQNGWFYVALAVFVGVVIKLWGLDGLWRGTLVVLGLSLVIVIHELGHFLAAKWCDVHVLAFSLGFGPALPGCSFKRGETTFKICMIPLGGFVQMVGEGSEADEDENYPRSFKKKTVWQRMFIISAGVIMNLILGFLCFIIVYQAAGMPVQPATVGYVEPGSPAWKKGVRSGTHLTRIGGSTSPDFEDLRENVALGWGAPVELKTEYEGQEQTLTLKPRDDDNDTLPVIGVAAPLRLELFPEQARKYREAPARLGSPAAAARVIDLRPGDVVVAASDPDKDGELTSLGHDVDRGTFDSAELCRRMRGLKDRPFKLSVLRASDRKDKDARPEEVDVPAGGFAFGDEIIGTTDPAHAWPAGRRAGGADGYDVLAVTELKPKPGGDGQEKDWFDFQKRMRQLEGLPAVVEVRRAGKPAWVLVPPAYHVGFGLRMKMGVVAAVREGSPAAKAGVKEGDKDGDVILGVRVVEAGRDAPLLELREKKTLDPAVGLAAGVLALAPEAAVRPLDPVRLPGDLRRAAAAAADVKKVQVELTVNRWGTEKAPNSQAPVVLKLDWDDSWAFDEEAPSNAASAMAVPELGIAYRVESTVVEVAPGSPAADAGLKPGDQIQKIRFKDGEAADKWDYWKDMQSKRGDGTAYDQWAHYDFILQRADFPTVQVRVSRDNQLLEPDPTLTATEDPSWPAEDRGVLLQPDSKLQKANDPLEAIGLGAARTARFLRLLYKQLPVLLTNWKSWKLLGGPVAIAGQTFEAAQDPFLLLFWLGFISVNLAVLNFLPIPMLDGGHMVFLIYELIRRRPPSDRVRAVASYVGLALILLLLVCVSFQDIMRGFFRN